MQEKEERGRSASGAVREFAVGCAAPGRAESFKAPTMHYFNVSKQILKFIYPAEAVICK